METGKKLEVRKMRATDIPRNKKKNFLKNFSETEFRDKVIRPLFFRLGYSDGRDLCGPQEEGKDCIFTFKDQFGAENIHVVQTKKGNLNLSSKASQNLIEATTQMKTALQTKITIDKRRVQPDKCFLCVSGKINEQARRHIADETRNNIKFLDAEDLIISIDRNFPELWMGIDSELSPYLKAIREIVENQHSVKPDGSPIDFDILTEAASDSRYTKLELHRQTIKKKQKRGKIIEYQEMESIPATSVLEKINHNTSIVLIKGEAGSGKSTILLRIAYEICKKQDLTKVTTNYKIPILMKAKDLIKNQEEPLTDKIDKHTREIAKTKNYCYTADDMDNGRLVVMIDALDEVPSHEQRKAILHQINRLSQTYKKIKFIISSRQYPKLPDETSILFNYEKFNISPIGLNQAKSIVQQVIKNQNNNSIQVKAKEVIRQIQQVHGFEISPLFITVFIATDQYSRNDIPANITELFKKFTELLIGRWDQNKGLSQQYQAPLKDYLLKGLAFQMHSRKETVTTIKDVKQYIQNKLEESGHYTEMDSILEEVLYRSGLLRIIGDKVEFKHLLIQEFFAGRGIPSNDFIKKHIGSPWWKKAIVFYFGEHPDKTSALFEATESLLHESNALQIIESVTTIGLSVQACYLSKVDDKMKLWKWVVSEITKNREGFMRQIDRDGKYPIVSFLEYVIYAHDSIALSNISNDANIREIRQWIKENTEKEELIFWLIIALIETGNLDKASKLIAELKSTNHLHPIAIHMTSFIAKEVREIEESQKREAEDICRKLSKKVGPFVNEINQEFDSRISEILEIDNRTKESNNPTKNKK